MSGTVVLEGHATEDGLTTDPQHLSKLSKQQQIVSSLIFLSLIAVGFRITFHEIIEEQSLKLTALVEEQLPDKKAAVDTWLSIYSIEAAKKNTATAEMALNKALALAKASYPQGSPEYVAQLLHIATTNYQSTIKSSNILSKDDAGILRVFRAALQQMANNRGMKIQAGCLTLTGEDPSNPEDVRNPFGLLLNQKLSESDIRMIYAHLLSDAGDWSNAYNELSTIARVHVDDDDWWRGKLSKYTARSVDFAHMVNKSTINMMSVGNYLIVGNETQAMLTTRRLQLLKPVNHLLRPWQLNEIR